MYTYRRLGRLESSLIAAFYRPSSLSREHLRYPGYVDRIYEGVHRPVQATGAAAAAAAPPLHWARVSARCS